MDVPTSRTPPDTRPAGERHAPAPRRPPGWTAPGPAPTGTVPPLGPGEGVSYLTGDWRILQRTDGHRWSLDDLVTAYVARDAIERALGRPPRTVLDLGTGIGSVGLMLAWSFPEADVTGVEAQAISAALARRSIAMNGARMHVVDGDLRDYHGPPAELVTGTPPYFDDPLQPRSDAVQKGPCRFEDRGGIDDYLAAARRHVTPDGRVVVCHASRQRARVVAAATTPDWQIVRAVEVIPKVGKEALVDVLVLAPAPTIVGASLRAGRPGFRSSLRPAVGVPAVQSRTGDPASLDVGASHGIGAPAPAPPFEPLVVRDADDQWTPALLALRQTMGMPPRPR